MKRNPNIIYKLGYTESPDVKLRFTEEYHKARNFKEICFGRDFNVRPLWSGWFSKSEALGLEKEWKDLYPKNIWTDIQYNGITESRYFSYEAFGEVLSKYQDTYPYSNHSFEVAKAKYPVGTTLVKAYLVQFKKKFNEAVS